MDMNTFGMLQELLGIIFGFHETSFSDLPPLLADRYHAANSRLRALFTDVEDFQVLAPTVKPFVDAYWISRDRTGAKATTAGWAVLPEMVTFGGYCERWVSVSGMSLYMMPSATSARCAVVAMVPKELDSDTGYDRIYPSTRTANDGAEFFVLQICDDAVEAKELIVQAGRDWRTMQVAADENARIQERHSLRDEGDGASF